MNDLDERLKWAAERAIGAQVAFVSNIPIVETFRGQIVWEGIVSDFTTEDGRHVYAWAVESDQGPRYLAVIQEPPIKTALDAVRAWLVSQARK